MKNIIYSDASLDVLSYFKNSKLIDSNSDFSSLLSLCKDEEEVSLGFLISGGKRGISDETALYISKSLRAANDFYFSYLWICSVGKYARFNSRAMERFISYFKINASLTIALSDEKKMDECCKKVESGAIEIPFFSLFPKLYAKRIYKKFN